MKIGKIKPVATIVAQFAAGVEVDAIQHEGKLFMPCILLGDFGSKDSAPVPTTKTKDAAPEVDEEEVVAKPKKLAPVAEEKTSSVKVYEESELMEMDTKSLLKILKEHGVNADDFEGKNTNKKLRLLVLDAQEGSEDSPEVEDEVEVKAKSKKKVEEEPSEVDEESLTEDVVVILEDFDAGKINKKKALSKIMESSVEGVEDEDVSKLLATFEDDSDADVDDTAETIVKVILGKSVKKEKGGKSKKESKEVLLDRDDLEVGQRVLVYWEDNEEWYAGEVKSIKKGKIVISYDDESVEPLDDNTTKIKAE